MEVDINALKKWSYLLDRLNHPNATKVYNDIRTALKMHGTGRPFSAKGDRCVWNNIGSTFITECKNTIQLYNKEDNVRFCPCCGKEINLIESKTE